MASPPKGGVETPIPSGLVARVSGAVSGAVKGAISGATTAWFGPGEPLPPVAPEETKGRRIDYQFGVNLPYQPRSEQGENTISFETLRRMADPALGGLDVLRLVIESRKDQMEGQKWKIVARDDEGDGGDRAREIERTLRKPDIEHTYNQWQRLLLEDLFVIDAPALYFADAMGGDKIPQVMDGALFKRLVRPDGRTPLPPEPAFTQVLKGMPAVEYTLDELLYVPRNLRPNRIYGYSPVEQVISTVNIALRRQLSQLEYYTAGSVPDVVFGTPPEWSAAQVKEFQDLWDSILAGNTAERRRARFVPGGVNPFPLRPDVLKDQFDEWLARIVCYAFSLSPQALVQQMNRATAETAKEEAQEQGLESVKAWWKGVMDEVLARAYGAEDLEFVYRDEEITDPATKSKVWSTAVGGKAFATMDEAREAHGLPPMTPKQREELAPAPPPMLGMPGMPGAEGPPGIGAQAAADAGSEEQPSDEGETAAAEKAQRQAELRKLRRSLHRFYRP